MATSKNWALTPEGERRLEKELTPGWKMHIVRSPTSSDGDGPPRPSDEVMDAIREAEVYYGFGIPRPLFLAAQRLRWVHSAAAGVGSALYTEMVQSDVLFTNSAGIHAVPIAEFVVGGEKIENWTELVTMITIRRRSTSDPLEIFFNKVSQAMSNDCPLSVWNVIARGEGSLLYERKAQNCRGVAEQHEIGRFLDGKYNRFRLAYVKKVKALSAEERDKWIKLLSEASIVTQ